MFTLDPAKFDNRLKCAQKELWKNRIAVFKNAFIRSSPVTIMDLCFWVRSQTKSNGSCLWKKNFEANGRMFPR